MVCAWEKRGPWLRRPSLPREKNKSTVGRCTTYGCWAPRVVGVARMRFVRNPLGTSDKALDLLWLDRDCLKRQRLSLPELAQINDSACLSVLNVLR